MKKNKNLKYIVGGLLAVALVVTGTLLSTGNQFQGYLNLKQITPLSKAPVADIKILGKAPNIFYIKNLKVSQNPYDPSTGPLKLSYDTNFVQKTGEDKFFNSYLTNYDPSKVKIWKSNMYWGSVKNTEGTNTLTWNGIDQNTDLVIKPGTYYFSVTTPDNSIPAAQISFEIKY